MYRDYVRICEMTISVTSVSDTDTFTDMIKKMNDMADELSDLADNIYAMEDSISQSNKLLCK